MPGNRRGHNPGDDCVAVYSTISGDLRKQAKGPAPETSRSLTPGRQTAYLHRESKGRGGKTVTLIKNLQLSPDELKALAKRLKQACGTGGTSREGVIEIQGDQRPRIAETLQELGYKVKIAGG